MTNTPENNTESPKTQRTRQHITGNLYYDMNTKKFSKKLMALAKFNITPTDKLKEMLEKKQQPMRLPLTQKSTNKQDVIHEN